MIIKQLSAKARSLVSLGVLQKRCKDGKAQVKTLSGRVLEQAEHFPYGFAAKAKKGKTSAFCSGGGFNSFAIMPIAADGSVKPPELEEGGAALYAESGGRITARENGTAELFGTGAGGVVKAEELKNQLDKLPARVDGGYRRPEEFAGRRSGWRGGVQSADCNSVGPAGR